MDENLKAGLVIGVPLAIGAGLLFFSIVRGGAAAPYQPPVNGVGCTGNNAMSMTPRGSGVSMTFFNQATQSMETINTSVPHQQLPHSLNLGYITQIQYDCGMAQLASLGI